ncbi:hypothetical protein BDE02_16G116900 [Populus trichocarpa]|nr:hypothetical protein BDE02_16G116900 [Populus trichocarpa]
MWVWQNTRLNTFRFSCALSPSICGFDKMPNLTHLNSAACRAQLHVGLTRC